MAEVHFDWPLITSTVAFDTIKRVKFIMHKILLVNSSFEVFTSMLCTKLDIVTE